MSYLKILSLLFFGGIFVACQSSQSSTNNNQQKNFTSTLPDSAKIYSLDEVDQKPKIIGGERKMLSNMRYPKKAREAGIKGEVILNFVITEEGNAANFEVKASPHQILTKEAIRVASESSYIPGQINGHFVNTYYSMPFNFRMQTF